MPIPIRNGRAAHAVADERVEWLEQEVLRLRRDMELGKTGGSTAGGHSALQWLTPVLAAFALLLAIVALVRH